MTSNSPSSRQWTQTACSTGGSATVMPCLAWNHCRSRSMKLMIPMRRIEEIGGRGGCLVIFPVAAEREYPVITKRPEPRFIVDLPSCGSHQFLQINAPILTDDERARLHPGRRLLSDELGKPAGVERNPEPRSADFGSAQLDVPRGGASSTARVGSNSAIVG